jgi:hypothetical protein
MPKSHKPVYRGNCYAASEALYHLLGGKRAGWKAMYMNTKETGHHYLLQHKSGLILDPTVKQFGGLKPDYSKAKGIGFLTKRPCKRTRELMERILWTSEIV